MSLSPLPINDPDDRFKTNVMQKNQKNLEQEPRVRLLMGELTAMGHRRADLTEAIDRQQTTGSEDR